MNIRLVPCSDCLRHVRVHEAQCPFCKVVLSPDLAVIPLPVPPPSGLSRASQFRYATLGVRALVGGVFGASMLACDGGGTAGTPLYGGSCIDDCGMVLDGRGDVVSDAVVSKDVVSFDTDARDMLPDAQVDEGGSKAAADAGLDAANASDASDDADKDSSLTDAKPE